MLTLRIPPVAQAVLAILLIWVLNRYVPLSRIQFIYQHIAAFTVAGLGAVVALSAVYAFIKLKTTVDPRRPERARELVIVGIYNYSRNPMYLGILLAISGAALYWGALSSILVIIFFVGFIRKYQIEPEEAALRKKFGDQYARYARRVRRWL